MKNAQRDADICAYYREGRSLAACELKFGLKRQRMQQILKKGDAWCPYEKSTRTEFLGVSISEETKAALKRKAEQEGLSVSKLTSDALDALVEDK